MGSLRPPTRDIVSVSHDNSERNVMGGKQLSIYLSELEIRELMNLAHRECRRPNDQARFILRSVLLNEQTSSINDNSTVIRQDRTGAAVQVNP